MQDWSVNQRLPVPWTTVFGAASPNARYVYLLIEAHDTGNPPFDSSIWVRAAEGEPEIRVVHARFEYSDEEIHHVGAVFVPVVSGSFQFKVDGGFREGYTIAAIGEMT